MTGMCPIYPFLVKFGLLNTRIPAEEVFIYNACLFPRPNGKSPVSRPSSRDW
jgi:hypothetical protein